MPENLKLKLRHKITIMKIVCEILSLAMYRYSDLNALYITLKNSETEEIFNGKYLMKEIPACILQRHVVVEHGKDIIGKQVLKRRNQQDSEINRYDLTSISEYKLSV